MATTGPKQSKRLRRLALLGVAATGTAAYATWAAPRRWLVDDDPCGPEGITLPGGEATTIVTDDGARLEVLVAGPDGAPTVVLPHCWGGTRALWAPVARRLVTTGHRVVLYDQRGHGTSAMGSDPATVDRLGADLRTVLEHLDARDVVLAGHSMGGMTIQALAVNHPEALDERARAVVLVATSSRVLPRPLAAAVADRVIGDTVLRPLAATPASLAMCRRALGKRAYRSHVVATRDAFFGTAGPVRSGFLVGMSAMDYRLGLASVRVPTTVLVGTQDRLTPPRMARVLASAIPGAELVVLPGAGHMLPLETPAEVADAIAAHTGAGSVVDPVSHG